MAENARNASVSMPKLIGAITLRVRFARLAGFRVRLAALVMRVAARVAGCDIESDAGDDEIQFTWDGLPRALSIIEGYKGYRRDAIDHALGLLIRLDGVEQRDVVSFDIDAKRVSNYVRDDHDQFRLARMGSSGVEGAMIYHHKGVVTVERRLG